jgi:hypothetical protein
MTKREARKQNIATANYWSGGEYLQIERRNHYILCGFIIIQLITLIATIIYGSVYRSNIAQRTDVIEGTVGAVYPYVTENGKQEYLIGVEFSDGTRQSILTDVDTYEDGQVVDVYRYTNGDGVADYAFRMQTFYDFSSNVKKDIIGLVVCILIIAFIYTIAWMAMNSSTLGFSVRLPILDLSAIVALFAIELFAIKVITHC